MLAAIQFNVYLRLLAKEIQIVNAARMLAAKLVAAEPPVTKPAPHQLFCPSVILAKLAGACDVGHDGKLRNVGPVGKLVLTLALTCVLSPGERISPVTISFYSNGRPNNPVLDFSKDAENVIALSLEERVG